MSYLRRFSKKQTPQSEPIAGAVPNSAGGYAFPVDHWTRLHRFLVLGSEGGTYYIGERELTRENAEAVERCIAEDGRRAVDVIVEISQSGRAPKNDPALFALALACKVGDEPTRAYAYRALPMVARIGTHLFSYAQFIEQFGGWGQGTKRAVQRWYLGKDVSQVAFQAVKYQQRNGWSHRDLLRLAHPKAAPPLNALLEWIVKGGDVDEGLPDIVRGFVLIQSVGNPHEAAGLIRQYRLPREAVPAELLTSAEVWSALFEEMPLTAMIRNLATMTRVGLLTPMSDSAKQVGVRLTEERIRNARVHPVAILAAMLTYASGHGERGKHTWEPVGEVVDALDAAFYLSFGNVEATGKRLMLALDVSGSMAGGSVAGVRALTPRVASAAMALVTAAVEPSTHFVAFTAGTSPTRWSNYGAGITDLAISPRQRLDDVVKSVSNIPFGGTDCSLPMVEATRRKLDVDAFLVYTDSETWAGNIHPSQALAEYRRKAGKPAKSVVVGMTSNGFSIADPNDAGMLDVVGFDTATPNLISDFVSDDARRTQSLSSEAEPS